MTGRRTIPFDLSGAIGQIGRTETGIAPAHDLSLTVLFAAAVPVVKAVLVILGLASVACWTIVFEKLVRLGRVARSAVLITSFKL